jgi:HPt (histidine-containing phosphotransfer) domain-containing protein
MQGDRERCLAAGMDEYVTKPIQPRELYQVLGRFAPQAAAPRLSAAPAAPAPPDQVLDAAALRTRCGGRMELVRQVARLFLSECPRYLDRLRAAQLTADAAALEFAAHALKGSVGNLGGGPAYAAARRVEELAKAGRLDDATAALADLERELDRFRPALRELLTDTDSPETDSSARDAQGFPEGL